MGQIGQVGGDGQIRLLAIDIDGTLLDSKGRLPDAHRDVLVAAAAKGIEVALVTGRSFHFSQSIVALLPIPVTLINNNGALVKDASGATLMRHLLPRDTAHAVLRGTPEFEDSVALMFDRPPGSVDRQVVYERMDWSHPNRRGYFEKNSAFIGETATLAGALTEDPIQVMFNGGFAAMRALAARLKALPIVDRYSVSLTEYEHRDFSLVDVNGAGCSKGATLARWAQTRGFARDAVLAAGDNLNDVEMLDYAGTAVLMGNASDDVRRRVPRARLTTSNDEGGLASALRDLLRGLRD